VWLHDHRHNFKDDDLEKSKLVKQTYEEGHWVGWEGNRRYRQYKELAVMAYLTKPKSAKPVWTFPPLGSHSSALRLASQRQDHHVQNRKVSYFGLYPSSGIYKTKKHNVSETGFVSVLRWMGQDKPTQLGPLERASLNHWTDHHDLTDISGVSVRY
jgi:hypothetical protein